MVKITFIFHRSLIYKVLLLILTSFVTINAFSANPTFTLSDGSKNAITGFNCESVSFDFTNPNSSPVYFQIFKGPLNSRDVNQFEDKSGLFSNVVNANSTIAKSNTDIGSFTYMVRFFINSNLTNQLGADQFIDVIVAASPTIQLLSSNLPKICENNNNIISLTSETGVNYQLYFDNGTTNVSSGSPIPGTGNTISFPAQTTKGIYTVRGVNATSGCSNQMFSNITILENHLVTVNISTPLNPICSGNNATFTVSSSTYPGTAPTFQWKINGSNVGTNRSDYSTTSLANGDLVSVIMTSNDPYDCLIGSPATSNIINMSVGESVFANVVIATTTNPICVGETVTFTTSTLYGGTTPTYQWYIDGASITGATGTSFARNDFINGNKVTVVMTSNYLPSACLYNSPKTSNEVTLVVNPLPILTRLDAIETSSNSVNDGQICSDASATLTPVLGSGTINDFRYLWTAPGSITIPQTSSSYQTPIGSGNGVYSLKIENLTTGCQSGIMSNTITVYQIPTAGTITALNGQNNICVEKSVQLTGSGETGVNSPFTYYWEYTSNVSGSTLTPTVLVTGVSAGVGSITYSVKDSKACMSSKSTPFTITINALPLIPTAVPSVAVYNANPHLANATVSETNVVVDWYDAISVGTLSGRPSQTNVGINTQFAEARNSITGCLSTTPSISRVSVSSEVTRATLTLTAKDKQKVYNKAIFSNGYEMLPIGFVLNESFGNLSGTATYSGTSQTAVNAGTYPIIPSGYTSANYDINYVNGTLTIEKKNIAVQGTSVITKVYDATKSATLTGSVFLTAIASGTGTSTDNKPYIGDDINLLTSAEFETKAAGINKSVIASYNFTSGSTGAGNYIIIQPTGLTGNITKKSIDEFNPASFDKKYDGTRIAVNYNSFLKTAQLPGSGNSDDGTPYTSDNITILPSALFSSKDVGSRTISSTSELSGTDAESYNLTRTVSIANKNITMKNLIMSGLTVPSYKIYDGTTIAVVTGSPGQLLTKEVGAVGTAEDGIPYIGDDISLTGNAEGTYNSKDVLTANSVTFSNLSLTGAQAGNYTLTIQAPSLATITPKSIDFTGLSVASSKIYDATKAAVVIGNVGNLRTAIPINTGSVTDNTPYQGDIVNLTGPAIGTYNSKDVLTASSVSFSGVILTGAQASNYSLTTHTSTQATITKKNISEISADTKDKVYDATTKAVNYTSALKTKQAPGAGTDIDGTPYTIDDVSIVPTAEFDNKNVGNSKSISSTSIIEGADKGNYELIKAINLMPRNVTKKSLNMTGLSVPASKVYDGTTSTVLTDNKSLLTASLPGQGTVTDGKPYTTDISNLSITGTAIGTYNSKNVLTANTVTYTGLSLSGTESGNYSLTIQVPQPAIILKKELTMSGLSVPSTKIYDANTKANVLDNKTLQNKITAGTGNKDDGKPYDPDDVSLSGTAVANYNSKDVVTAIVVNFSGLSLAGADASNYSLKIQTQYNATITPLVRNVVANQQNKIYGQNDPVFTYTADPLLESDLYSGELKRVDGKNVGSYPIEIGTLTGGSNYNLNFTSNVLIIDKAIMFITAKDAVRTYGDLPLVTQTNSTEFIADGLKYDEKVGYVTISYANGPGSGNAINDSVGRYVGAVNAVDVSGGTFNVMNYKSIFFRGDIIVNKLPIIVSAESKEKREGQQDPALTFKTSIPLVVGDEFTGSISREPGEMIGAYQIQIGTLALNNNYQMTFRPAVFTIKPEEPTFVLPKAFTPNGDGVNDVLKIIQDGISTINYYQIFNRSGRLVFQTKDLNEGWDGRFNGVVLDSDAYYWNVEFVTWNKKVIKISGTVILIK